MCFYSLFNVLIVIWVMFNVLYVSGILHCTCVFVINSGDRIHYFDLEHFPDEGRLFPNQSIQSKYSMKYFVLIHLSIRLI